MHELLKALLNLRSSLAAVFCVFYREGRQALLERAKARTDLDKLAVREKRMEIESQRIELIQKVAKIKDPYLREKAISSADRVFLED
jgi:hypothetical protein